MATIGEVFELAATHRAGIMTVTVVSNQGDAIVSYTVGSMDYVSAPSRVMRGTSPVFLRDHLASRDNATVLFSDRTATLRSTNPEGLGQQQPFNVEAPNHATLALAPSQSNHADSKTWEVFLALPAPFNRTFDFTATVMGSTIVGTTPAVGMSENVDHATHVVSLKFVDAPR
jgi:hypothetical protein